MIHTLGHFERGGVQHNWFQLCHTDSFIESKFPLVSPLSESFVLAEVAVHQATLIKAMYCQCQGSFVFIYLLYELFYRVN